MITLLLIAVLAGSSLLYLDTNDQSELSELRVAALQLVQDARSDASLNERANYLNVNSQKIWVDTQNTGETNIESGKRSITIPEGVSVYYASQGSDDWSALSSSAPARWCISGSGLSEPIHLKFQVDDGAYDELLFDPFFLHPLDPPADES